MRLHRYASVEDWLGIAGAYLAAREAEHNLLLGIAGTLRDHPEIYPDPPYLAAVTAGPTKETPGVRLVAIRTPPRGLVLSEPAAPVPNEDDQSVALVAEDLAGSAPDLPGVLGPRDVARAFAERWLDLTGTDHSRDIAERIYRLRRVEPPSRMPRGHWRLAEPGDSALLGAWIVAFQREAVPNDPLPSDLDATVAGWIRRVGRTMYLWEVDGRVVSAVGAGSATPHGIRIGPVYTSPAERGRGYASALTAAASQAELDQGRQFCFLFTDLANPTSNRIYRSIGYEPVADVDSYRFGLARTERHTAPSGHQVR